MLLFRSEEEVDRWCRARRVLRGAVVPADRLWQLAELWYGDRLDPNWRPRSRERSQEILAACGLVGEFWRL